MRKIIFFLSICIISLNLHPQELFIEGNTVLKSSNANVKTYLEKGDFIQSFTGKINMSVLDGQSITLTIPDGNTQNFILKEKNHEKWIGVSSEGSDNVILIINDGTVYGVAFLDNRRYQICSFEDYTCILSEVDQSVVAKGATPLIPKDKKSSSELRAATSSSGNVRVLVAYTKNAEIGAGGSGNIFSIVKLGVELTNQSYANSQINHKLELAACIPVNYTEVGYNTDLDRLQNKSDGFMDEVHQFRDIYAADVCVLVSSIPEWETRQVGGVAFMGPRIDNAFANVHYSAMNNWRMFSHELGHTQGADHDIAQSSNYGYNHGYVSPDKTWRTIMAYGNDCGYCGVALQWSNPDVLYKGVPTGRVGKENNAKVLNDNIPIMKGFRTPPNDLTISSAQLKGKDYIDAVAKNQVQTSGTINIPSGNEIRMRAGNSVILNPGFSLNSGSTLQIDITTIE